MHHAVEMMGRTQKMQVQIIRRIIRRRWLLRQKSRFWQTRPPLGDRCGEWGTNMAGHGEIWEGNLEGVGGGRGWYIAQIYQIEIWVWPQLNPSLKSSPRKRLPTQSSCGNHNKQWNRFFFLFHENPFFTIQVHCCCSRWSSFGWCELCADEQLYQEQILV